MTLLPVNLGDRSYEIHIAAGLLDGAGEAIRAVCPKAETLFVVTDSTVAPLYLARLLDSLRGSGFRVASLSVPAGERSKSAHNLVTLWEAMLAKGLTRTDGVVALGGGVVGDLAGFAAATLLRGVDFIQIPTTLLAQVDSSVGGKVAIDLRAGKNLAGCFWQPRLVLMDPETLNTLPDRTFSDGMAEVIKYGCIWDQPFFRFLRDHPSRAQIMGNIEHVLYTCCNIKREVVEKDERDTGLRQMLNFGHTLGHAYELAGGYETWSHGQAVAAGMVAAMGLGIGLGVTPEEDLPPLLELLTAFDLPLSIPCDRATLEKAVGLDKKGQGEEITLILLERMGRAILHKMPKRELLERLSSPQ